jgi:hypothetical protein
VSAAILATATAAETRAATRTVRNGPAASGVSAVTVTADPLDAARDGRQAHRGDQEE